MFMSTPSLQLNWIERIHRRLQDPFKLSFSVVSRGIALSM